jgi:hypothetical protein
LNLPEAAGSASKHVIKLSFDVWDVPEEHLPPWNTKYWERCPDSDIPAPPWDEHPDAPVYGPTDEGVAWIEEHWVEEEHEGDRDHCPRCYARSLKREDDNPATGSAAESPPLLLQPVHHLPHLPHLPHLHHLQQREAAPPPLRPLLSEGEVEGATRVALDVAHQLGASRKKQWQRHFIFAQRLQALPGALEKGPSAYEPILVTFCDAIFRSESYDRTEERKLFHECWGLVRDPGGRGVLTAAYTQAIAAPVRLAPCVPDFGPQFVLLVSIAYYLHVLQDGKEIFLPVKLLARILGYKSARSITTLLRLAATWGFIERTKAGSYTDGKAAEFRFREDCANYFPPALPLAVNA